MERERTYIAIDLKSFYASVECVERGLNPLTTNLVVADPTRTEKTICLAVSPSLKAHHISGRARLFEVIAQVKQVNADRRRAFGKELTGSSYDDLAIKADPGLAVDYIVAPPQMALYMKRSTEIYSVYLRYVAPEDMHVYSVDEVFLDVTEYLNIYQMSPHDLALKMVRDVLMETGITATAGIGSNMYLCKIAMDVLAKKMPADQDGVRIAQLNERSYRELMWDHKPLTDFWRVGRGYAEKLAQVGLFTMGDIARCSIGEKGDYHNEDLLYKLFGVNAELLIDHAWGWEPATISQIKSYVPEKSSISTGQVLTCPYEWDKARIVLQEMADMLSLDLVDKRLTCDQIVLTIGYDIENLTDPDRKKAYKGSVVRDHYGRLIPKHGHGTVHLDRFTSSTRIIMEKSLELYDRITDPALLIRRITLVADHVVEESFNAEPEESFEQMDLFTDYTARDAEREKEKEELEKERRLQQAALTIKKKYGKNAILRGMNLQEGATAKDRNAQIGGHKA